MRTFMIHEIEHSGDEEDALEALAEGGCTDIEVLERDYEGEESIVVRATLPADLAKLKAVLAERGVVT
jgi:transcriptional/translational regulatory protein YebC/TACO1